MGKLPIVLLIALVGVGAGLAVSNQMNYATMQPFPMAWNHTSEEMELVELQHDRREFEKELASSERQAGVGGMHTSLEATSGRMEEIKAQIAEVDKTIAAWNEKHPAAATAP